MSKDPCYTSARQRIELLTGHDFGNVYPLVGDREYELKLGWRPRRNKRTEHNSAQNAFIRLAAEFNNASHHDLSCLDPDGLIPQPYTLTSFQFDTKDTRFTPATPTALFHQHGMQFRLRGPINAHSSDFWQNPITFYDSLGANLKDSLSAMEDGQHRLEVEHYITDPYTGYEQFTSHFKGLPNFVYQIDPQSLHLNAVCMTARSGFFMVTQIPGTTAFATIHGVFDCSRFTTPSMEHFTETSPRWEVELEVKEFMGPAHLGLYDPAVQQEMVNKLFPHLTQKARDLGFFVYKESKLEDATASVERCLVGRIPKIANNDGIPPGLYHALSTGPSLTDLFNDFDRRQHSHPLFALARSMPAAEDMVSNKQFLGNLDLVAA